MISLKPGSCGCGAPATHFFAEGKRRTRALTAACCSCYEREMSRVAALGGSCGCGHPNLLHDEDGCRVVYCDCEKENPAAGSSGSGVKS